MVDFRTKGRTMKSMTFQQSKSCLRTLGIFRLSALAFNDNTSREGKRAGKPSDSRLTYVDGASRCCSIPSYNELQLLEPRIISSDIELELFKRTSVSPFPEEQNPRRWQTERTSRNAGFAEYQTSPTILSRRKLGKGPLGAFIRQ